MHIIQICLVIAVGLISASLFSNIHNQRVRAWKRILLLLFLLLMVVAILAPETTNHLANFVGVGRGADLLLYCLAITFIFFVFNVYIKFQNQRNQIYRLARKLAIYENKTESLLKDDASDYTRSRR